MKNTLYVQTRQEWRQWLRENFDKQSEIWFIYYKKHTRIPSVPYNEAVEEALCFGWVDSLVKKIDEQKYAQKFTPRRKGSSWSDLNKKRVKKMIAAGKMTEAGLQKIEFNPDEPIESVSNKKNKGLTIPAYIINVIKRNKAAWKNYNNRAPSHKRNYIGWIDSARKEETRQRRLKEAVQKLERNETLGLK